MTSIAEPLVPSRGGSWFRSLLLVAFLGYLAWLTPGAWGGLWLMVPSAVAMSLLIAWRWGAWGVLVPVAIFAATMLTVGPFDLWAWWTPVAALTGTWMGLREEGGGPGSGERAGMLLPVLLLAALLPWMMNYGPLLTSLESWLRLADQQAPGMLRQLGYQGERLKAWEQAQQAGVELRAKVLPNLVPAMLFIWMVGLVSAGRALASQFARRLRWPELSTGRLAAWRLPDGAIWLFLVGLALLVARLPSWSASAWTLLIASGLGYCVQGSAVVGWLMLARGVPPSIIALTFVFVLATATPVFVLATACVGVSDVWLDYRGLEAVPDGDSS